MKKLKTKAKIKLKLGQKIALSTLIGVSFSLGLNFAAFSVRPNDLNRLNIKKAKVVKTEKVITEEGGIGMANPAAVYCNELGYEYKIINDENGQHGECIFSNDNSCEGWEFLQGKCGTEYSYCAKQGYDQIVKKDGQNALTSEYAVCVTDKGKELGSVTNLSKTIEKSIIGEQVISREDLEQINNAAESNDELITLDHPSYFDWRDVDGDDWMTSVKDQGTCGSCWAFATVGATEAAFNIASNDPDFDPDLAEQELVSCNGGNDCNGGSQYDALDYIKNLGIKDEKCFPYNAIDDRGCDYYECGLEPMYCSDKCSDLASIKIEEYQWALPFPSLNPIYSTKEKLLSAGPLIVSIQMKEAAGYFDENEIYRCDNENGYSTNHVVVIVGYNDIEEYWIVKNSWGTDWPNPGDDGYFKLGFEECNLWQAMAPIGIDYGLTCEDNEVVANFKETDLSVSEDVIMTLGHEECCVGSDNDCVYQGSCFNSHLPNEANEIHAKVDDTYCEASSATTLAMWHDCDSSELACESFNYCNRLHQGWHLVAKNNKWALPGDFGRIGWHYGPMVGEYNSDQYECCGDDPGEYPITNITFGETRCCDTATDYLDENGECAPCAKGDCVRCYNDANCEDRFSTTIDVCHNPGLDTSYCVHTPSQELEEI